MAEGTKDEKEYLEKKRKLPDRTRRGKGAEMTLPFFFLFLKEVSLRLHLFDTVETIIF